jgi:hypothetical protein
VHALAPTVPLAATLSPSTCRTADPLGNVYHPYRLRVVNRCITISGTVTVVRAEDDGDLHFDLALDSPYAGLVNNYNVLEQRGALVAEIVPADEPGCTPCQAPRPASGSYDNGTCTVDRPRPVEVRPFPSNRRLAFDQP